MAKITDAQKRAVLKYDAANTKQYHLKLNLKTDADIIERLETVGSMQGYIKGLIRRDMQGGRLMVINRAGKQVDYEAAVNLMDDEIREALAAEGIETEQEFFTAYEDAHEKKYGQEWELSKVNPVW